FIDNRVMPGDVGGRVVAPTKRGIHHHTLGEAWRTVAGIQAEVRLGVADGIAKQGVTPANGAGNGFGIGIEEQLRRIEAVAVRGDVWTMDTVAIVLSRAYLG